MTKCSETAWSHVWAKHLIKGETALHEGCLWTSFRMCHNVHPCSCSAFQNLLHCIGRDLTDRQGAHLVWGAGLKNNMTWINTDHCLAWASAARVWC